MGQPPRTEREVRRAIQPQTKTDFLTAKYANYAKEDLVPTGSKNKNKNKNKNVAFQFVPWGFVQIELW
jgi:hypothetical protein